MAVATIIIILSEVIPEMDLFIFDEYSQTIRSKYKLQLGWHSKDMEDGESMNV